MRQGKANPDYKRLANQLRATERIEKKIREKMDKISKVPSSWWALRDNALKVLDRDYTEVRIKGALNGLNEQQKKKLLKDFASKDYLQSEGA